MFLSFDYDDLPYVDLFRGLRTSAPIRVSFRDRSLQESVESDWHLDVKDELARRIHGCSVCICLIGRRTFKSRWVGWEVRTAAEQGRGLLGIVLPRCGVARIPKALLDWDVDIVNWAPSVFEGAIEYAARQVGY